MADVKHTTESTVHLPSPTAWPFALAAGVVLVFAALVTYLWIGILGAVLVVFSSVGWFREVLPREKHVDVPVQVQPLELTRTYAGVSRIEVSETHRAQLPLETYPISSGLKGGIAGGIAMIIPAEIYGLIAFHSLWYTINLLGGAGALGGQIPTQQYLVSFHLDTFLIACAIHGASSILVGLLYGALLPVWPQHPILLGGVVGPLLWTGGLHSVLGIVNPFFNARISWPWFAASQFFFGIVAGITVTRFGKLQRLAQLPLNVRLGIQSPGLIGERREGDQR